MGINDIVDLGTRDNMELLRELFEVPNASRAYVCAQLIGLLELVLTPSETDIEKTNQQLYEETGVERFRDIAMRQPLAKRHEETAFVSFQELREGVLSFEALHKWQTLLRA